MDALKVLLAGPYNLLYAAGFAAAFMLAAVEGRRRGLSPLPWLALLTACVAGGIAGSKLMHFDLHVAQAGEKTILGGLTGGILAFFLVTRFLRISGDPSHILAPAALFGFALGRVGCFLAGCCFGLPTSAPWGVQYQPGTRPFDWQMQFGLVSEAASNSLPVHPTQIYEAGLAFLLALAILRYRNSLRSFGAPALLLGAGYGVIRFWVEFFRASDASGLAYGLRTVQWSLLMVVILLTALLVWRELAASTSVTSPVKIVLNGSTIRAEAVLAGSIAFLFMGGRWLTPLESLVLAMAFTPLLVAVVQRWSVSPGILLGRGLATAAVAIVPFSLDTIPDYPRTGFSLGSSIARGGYDTVIDLSPGDDCGPSEHRTHRSEIKTVAGGIVRETSPSRRIGLNLAVLFGSNRVESLNGRVVNEDVSIKATAVSSTMDSPFFGLTGGFISGDGVNREGLPERIFEPVLGVRVGSMSDVFVDARYADFSPTPYPATRIRLSAGYGFGSGASNLRIGLWGDGVFLGGRLLTPWGQEIEPAFGFGERNLKGIAVRQRF